MGQDAQSDRQVARGLGQHPAPGSASLSPAGRRSPHSNASSCTSRATHKSGFLVAVASSVIAPLPACPPGRHGALPHLAGRPKARRRPLTLAVISPKLPPHHPAPAAPSPRHSRRHPNLPEMPFPSFWEPPTDSSPGPSACALPGLPQRASQRFGHFWGAHRGTEHHTLHLLSRRAGALYRVVGSLISGVGAVK